MSEGNKEERRTAAEIRREIAEATKQETHKSDIKDSGLPITGMLANEVNALESIPAKVEPKPQPEAAATGVEDPKPTDQASVDLKEWAQKKGINWTTEDSVLSALRKSDEAFHKKRQEERERDRANGQNGYPPVPQRTYVPPSQPAYAPPAYAPAPNPQLVETIARQYNMLPEDVERLANFNRDFFNSMIGPLQQSFNDQMNGIQRENQKNSVFRELSADPVFRRPEVAMEYHKVLTEMQASDPQFFEQNPIAYRRAYDAALANIGRRNLEGQPLIEGQTPQARQVTPPTTPPRQLGNGSGGGSLENENGIDAKQFARLSVEDKRNYLQDRGLIAGY